jgi:hypothetical protein
MTTAVVAPSPGARVPVEYVGLARRFRDRLAAPAAEARAGIAEIELLLRVANPRPGFRTPPAAQLAREVVRRWRVLPEFGTLETHASAVGRHLRLAELRVVPAKMRFESWEGDAELALALTMTLVKGALPRIVVERRLIADLGLHGLARRYERGTDRADEAVLVDLAALAPAWRAATERGGDFAIPAGSGRWIGSTTLVRDAPVLAVRTFVD